MCSFLKYVSWPFQFVHIVRSQHGFICLSQIISILEGINEPIKRIKMYIMYHRLNISGSASNSSRIAFGVCDCR